MKLLLWLIARNSGPLCNFVNSKTASHTQLNIIYREYICIWVTLVWSELCITNSYKDREERISRCSRNQSHFWILMLLPVKWNIFFYQMYEECWIFNPSVYNVIRSDNAEDTFSCEQLSKRLIFQSKIPFHHNNILSPRTVIDIFLCKKLNSICTFLLRLHGSKWKVKKNVKQKKKVQKVNFPGLMQKNWLFILIVAPYTATA